MSHSDFFDQIAEAAKAMQELPAAKAEINDLTLNLDIANECIRAKDSQIAIMNEQIANLQETLRAAREDRDNASFRELEACDRLENLLKAIQGASDLRPKAEPPKIVASEALPQDVEILPGHIVYVPEGEDPTTEVMQPQADPIVGSSISERSQDIGESIANGKVNVFGTESSQPSPLVESTVEASQDADYGGSTQDKAAQTSDAASPKPYWLKEPWMTWAEWEKNGGSVPSWVHHLHTT